MYSTLFSSFFFLPFLTYAATIPITQNDFKEGSYIIDIPGEYILMEDIVFAPKLYDFGNIDSNRFTKPELFMYPTQKQRDEMGRSFNLGFFAAIVISGENVVLDLNGFTLSQSYIHGSIQRFFSLIELANSPFPASKGPANFTTESAFKAAVNVTIKNGILGNSIHHGVHGNGCSNIVFKNLVIKEFVIAGISLNSAVNVRFENVLIENTKRDDRYSGRLTQIVFILQALSVHIEPLFDLTQLPVALKRDLLKGRENLREILRQVLDFEVEAEKRQIHDNYTALSSEISRIHPLVRTVTNGISDGSLVAGILLHATVNTGEFKKDFPEEPINHIELENVTIRNLGVSPVEFTGLKKSNGPQLKDMIGAAVDIDSIRDLTSTTMKYKSNALSELQILLVKMKMFIEENLNLSTIDPDVLRLLRRNGVFDEFVAWTEGDITWLELISSDGVAVFNNGDAMFHFIKGAIGIKIDQASNVVFKSVIVENIENYADSSQKSYFYQNLPLAEFLSDHSVREAFSISKRPYFGFGAKGVVLAANVDIKGDVSVSSLYSTNEQQVSSVEYIYLNKNIELDILVSEEVCMVEPKRSGLLAKFERVLPLINRNEFALTTENSRVFSIITSLAVISLVVAVLVFFKLRKDPTCFSKPLGKKVEGQHWNTSL